MRSFLTLIGVGVTLSLGWLGCGASFPIEAQNAEGPQPAVGALLQAQARPPGPNPAKLEESALQGIGRSTVLGRPYEYYVPSKYDKIKPTPLMIMLHGFGASGPLQETYFNFRATAESKVFLYAYPDGTTNPLGSRFWNAQEWCCDFFRSGVDDVAYVTAVINDMAKQFNVDPKRIYVIGHSNGGFMSHRLACALSTRIAGIVSLAGSQQQDPVRRCLPSEPVPIVQVHGDADTTITYGNNSNYPGARATVGIWAGKNRCSGRLTDSGVKLDLEAVLPGAETKVERYTGCPARGPVELWTIRGGSHLPALTPNFASAVYNFLSSHPR